MSRLAKSIREAEVPANGLAIFWIAQAGFVFKTPGGTVIYVDPYLTDYVAHQLPEYGQRFKRIMATPIEPQEVEADYVISTHAHPDHLDAEAAAVIARDPEVHFVGGVDCHGAYEQLGLEPERYTIFSEGERLRFADFYLTGVYADHGELAPDALGALLEFGDVHVWHVGDTAYRPEKWGELFEMEIDVIAVPINGAFGNLDAVEAAKLVQDSGAKVAIPCHYWMFPEHNGDPLAFLEACEAHAPDAEPKLMSQGEMFLYER